MEGELRRAWPVGVEYLDLAAQFEWYFRFQEPARAINQECAETRDTDQQLIFLLTHVPHRVLFPRQEDA